MRRSQARYPGRATEIRAKMKSVLTPLVENGTWAKHDWDREPVPSLDGSPHSTPESHGGRVRHSRSPPSLRRRPRASPELVDAFATQTTKRHAHALKIRPQSAKKGKKGKQVTKRSALEQRTPPVNVRDAATASARAARFHYAPRHVATRHAGDDDDDDDWPASGVVVQGRCQTLEKEFLRLNGPPDPTKVRPEPVIRRALDRLIVMIAKGEQPYHYHWSQLKAMRQDLIVQHLQNETAAAVEEVFARRALEHGDMRDYQKCSTALRVLFDAAVQGCRAEFDAYRILANVCQDHCKSDEVLKAMKEANAHGVGTSAEVKHALSVQRALTMGNWAGFWKLYACAPHCGRLIMDRAAPGVRLEAAKTLVSRFKPAAGKQLCLTVLGFDVPPRRHGGVPLQPGCCEEQRALEGEEVAEDERALQCCECLKLFGAVVAEAEDGAFELRGKDNRVESLVMPEEKDMKGHGHAEVKLTDFAKISF
jgi:SAC3 family protein LENG8/THP3